MDYFNEKIIRIYELLIYGHQCFNDQIQLLVMLLGYLVCLFFVKRLKLLRGGTDNNLMIVIFKITTYIFITYPIRNYLLVWVYFPFYIQIWEKKLNSNLARKYLNINYILSCSPVKINLFTNLIESKIVQKDTDDKTYIYVIHPHGILPFGSLYNMVFNLNKRVHILTATICFYIPIYRELLLFLGLSEVSKHTIVGLLKKDVSVGLFPGGAREALLSDPTKECIYLKNRKGFVKLALETNTPLVPVYTFGENNMFSQQTSGQLSYFLNQFKMIFGFSLPLLNNILPKRSKIITVVGDPVEIKENYNVDTYHTVYVEKLKQLYKKHCHLLETKSELVLI